MFLYHGKNKFFHSNLCPSSGEKWGTKPCCNKMLVEGLDFSQAPSIAIPCCNMVVGMSQQRVKEIEEATVKGERVDTAKGAGDTGKYV